MGPIDIHKRTARLFERKFPGDAHQGFARADKEVPARVAEALLYFVANIPEHKFTRKEIADWAGTTPESVIRTLGDFEDDNLIAQIGLTKEKELPNVPLLMDLGPTAEDRAALTLLLGPSDMGRPFIAPPALPGDRTAALRGAFDRALQDADLVREAAAQRLDVNPVPGAEMQERIAAFYKAPAAVVARTRELVAMGGGE